jgi:hypothetical protein
LRDRVRETAAALTTAAGLTIEHIAKSYIRKEEVVAKVLAARGRLVALSSISVQAAPLPLTKAGPTQLELVAEGCGYGYWRNLWRDEWGYWRWGRCVPKSWGSLSREQFSQ